MKGVGKEMNQIRILCGLAERAVLAALLCMGVVVTANPAKSTAAEPVFGRTAALAAEDSVPWAKLPNVDSAKLTDSVKTRAVKVMQAENCYFECSESIYACVVKAKPSATAIRAAGFVVRQVIRGKPDAQIHTELLERAKSVHPFKANTLAVDAAMCLGPDSAKVRVVAFADFDCPFCRILSPYIRSLAPQYGSKVQYCFKPFPVKGHGEVAVETSKAGLAAAHLGKFWEFHDALYKNFEKHSQAQVESYAQAAGLALAAFREARDGAAVLEAVGRHKRDGLKLGVKATPAIYVNGKLYSGEKTEVELKDRIEEELDITP